RLSCFSSRLDLFLNRSEALSGNTSSNSSEEGQRPVRRSLAPPDALGEILRFAIGASLVVFGLSVLYRAENGRNCRNVVGFALTLAGFLLLTQKCPVIDGLQRVAALPGNRNQI